jgi:DNA gyrase subunit B
MAETEPALGDAKVRIHHLKNLEHIRMCPGMYIGSSDERGLYHLVFELVHNSIDQFMAGHVNRISVELLRDGGCSVSDDGCGFPVDTAPGTERPILEALLCTPGNRRILPKRPYSTSCGLQGLGLPCVNALSIRTVAEIQRDGWLWRQEFHRGVPVGKLEKLRQRTATGTAITFWPDPEIFQAEVAFNAALITLRCQELAGLHRGLTIQVSDNRSGRNISRTFHCPEGLADLVRSCSAHCQVIHPHIFAFRHQTDEHTVEVAAQWTSSDATCMRSYANSYATTQHGTHLTGFRRSLSRSLPSFAAELGLQSLTGDGLSSDAEDGLTAYIAVQLPQPEFYGATRSRLANPEALGIVEREMNHHFREFFREHPKDVRAIIEQVLHAQNERRTARRLRKDAKLNRA